jgi:hypothetical protein
MYAGLKCCKFLAVIIASSLAELLEFPGLNYKRFQALTAATSRPGCTVNSRTYERPSFIKLEVLSSEM